MNEKEIFNHLLAMSLKISADRRLKGKKYNKLKLKDDQMSFSVDKILNTFTTFKCKMCLGKFTAKSDYYSHQCPNWKNFQVAPASNEIESQVPVFKIPTVPMLSAKSEEKKVEKPIKRQTKAKTTHKYRLILPKLTREPKTTSITNIGLELNPDYVQVHPKTPRNYFLKANADPKRSPPPLRPLPSAKINNLPTQTTSSEFPSTLRLFELLTEGTKNEIKKVEPPKLKFSIESILGGK